MSKTTTENDITTDKHVQPLISCPTSELAKNIRRNLKHMHRLLNVGDERDSQLIDLVNHMDTLAQQIETGN